MTVLKYLLATNVATTAEILKLKKDNPQDYEDLRRMTRDQMRHNNVTIDDDF